MKMFLLLLASVATISGCTAIASAADRGLSFRELEYQQGRDPLLPSNQSADIQEHTSQARLSPAIAEISTAIPAGTPRAEAEAVLLRAGAHCHQPDALSERCTYADVETRDEYVDAIRWNVRLDLDNGRVRDLSVGRSWVRS